MVYICIQGTQDYQGTVSGEKMELYFRLKAGRLSSGVQTSVESRELKKTKPHLASSIICNYAGRLIIFKIKKKQHGLNMFPDGRMLGQIQKRL